MYQCTGCGSIWHEDIAEDLGRYYESNEYRQSLDGSSDENVFYRRHDKEILDKFLYTGTTIFRNKIVTDIGCGCGAFLDFLNGVAASVITIESSKAYRKIMDGKVFATHSYVKEAESDSAGKVDVVLSFDVIEHVANPSLFMADI